MAASMTLDVLVDKYKRYVVQNIDLVSKIEGILRIISYLIPGNFEILLY